jgi:Pectate lyase superfamily protein
VLLLFSAFLLARVVLNFMENFMGIDLYMVSAKDLGAAGDGTTDDTTALQDWLDDSRTIKILPDGIYLISAELTLTAGGVKIIGSGRRSSVIKASTDITGGMLTIGNGSTAVSLTMEGVGFDGDLVSSTGLILKKINFSYFNGIEISNVDGVALDIKGAQDTEFRGVDVRFSGNLASTLPAVHIHNLTTPTSFDSNSLSFLGGDFEANEYTACLIEEAYGIGFVRTKFHGIISVDAPAVDLLHLVGAKRITVVSAQFSNAGRNSILIEANAGGTASAGVISSTTFIETANKSGGTAEAWHINLVKGRFLLDSNYFAEGTHDSYTVYGGDIKLGANTVDIGGVNMHLGDAATNIKRNYSGVAFSQASLAGHSYIAENGKTAVSVGIDGETHNRLQVQGEGRIRIGSGSSAVDTVIERKSANTIGLSTGDTWQVDGEYNQGMLRLGNYRLWVDSTGDLRIKNGTPSSDTDGTVVGTQS